MTCISSYTHLITPATKYKNVFWYSGKIRFIRQCSGTGPCGYCRRVPWVPGPRGQYSGKIRFIEKPGVQDEGGRHVAKRSSAPPPLPGIRTKSSMSALPFTFMMFPHIMFHQTSHIKPHEIDRF